VYGLRLVAPLLLLALLVTPIAAAQSSETPMTVIVYSDGTAVIVLHISLHTKLNGTAYAKISGVASDHYIDAKLVANASFVKALSGFKRIELLISASGVATNTTAHSNTLMKLLLVAENGSLQVVSKTMYSLNYVKLVATQVQHTTIHATGSFREILVFLSMLNKALLQRALEAKGMYFIKVNSVTTSISDDTAKISISLTIDLKGFAQYLANELGGNVSQYLALFKPTPCRYSAVLHIVVTPTRAVFEGHLVANVSSGTLLSFATKESEMLKLYISSPLTSLSMVGTQSIKSVHGLDKILQVLSALKSLSVKLASKPSPFSIVIRLHNHVLTISATTPRLIAKSGRGPSATLAAIEKSVISLVKAVSPSRLTKVEHLKVRIVAGDPRVRVVKNVVELAHLSSPGIVQVAGVTSTTTTATSTTVTRSVTVTSTSTVTVVKTVTVVTKTVSYSTVTSVVSSTIPITITKYVRVTTVTPLTITMIKTVSASPATKVLTVTVTKTVYTPHTVTKTVIKTVTSPLITTSVVTKTVTSTNWGVVGGMAAVIVGLAIALGVVAARRR